MRAVGWAFVIIGVVGCCGMAMLSVACQPAPRTAEHENVGDVPLFAPTDLRIHPFTSVKDWTGDNKPDGVEVLLELQDRFRDPTKATGTVLFELYDYRRNHPIRAASAWRHGAARCRRLKN